MYLDHTRAYNGFVGVAPGTRRPGWVCSVWRSFSPVRAPMDRLEIMANSWFRFYHEWDSDPKVQSMSEPMQRRLAMLFCSRCKEETLQERDRAFHWRISMGELAETKALFLEKGFIDEGWNLINWNRRQFLSDSSTDRVRRHRQAMKQNETLQVTEGNVTVTAPSVSVSVSEYVSDSVDTRILCESVGIFGMKEQADMNRLLAVYVKESGHPVDDAISHLTARWTEYQGHAQNLEWQYGSAYKFFMSGKWDTPTGWPFKEGVHIPAMDRRTDEEKSADRKAQEQRAYEMWSTMGSDYQQKFPWKGEIPA